MITQIYEPLVAFHREKTDEFVPQLASSWEILEDGTQYVFHIRPGVTFQGGQTLSAEDAAYTFQRGILQGGFGSPQFLLTEPLLGLGVYDITGIVDNYASADNRESLLLNPPQVLLAACNIVKSKIVANESAGTVTFNLAQAWSPFLATLAGSMGSILDKRWVVGQGGWNGNCDTWQNYYATQIGEDPLTAVANGTGPFRLDHWTTGVELVLARNSDYWRTTPLWTNGPSGTAFFREVTFLNVANEEERAQLLIAGNADAAQVTRDYYPALDAATLVRYDANGNFVNIPSENGSLAVYEYLPGITEYAAVFNYSISPTSQYIGTGAWGTGIPTNFFSDVHIRRAFNYAFDWEVYINQVYGGYGLQPYGPIIKGLMGYSAEHPHFTHDPALAAAEMALAFGGETATNGFTFTCVYNVGALWKQKMCELVKAGMEALNPAKYHINLQELDWAAYSNDQANYRLPTMFRGWIQDIPHPHNWMQAFLIGSWTPLQRMPQPLVEKYSAKVNACLALFGDAERVCYEDIQTSTIEDALQLYLVQYTSNFYLNAAVNGFYHSPSLNGLYFYALSKDPAVAPGAPTAVSWLDAEQNQVEFTIPAGAASESVRLTILADVAPQAVGPDLVPSNLAFFIQAHRESDGSPAALTFDPPLQFVIHYIDQPIMESSMRLYTFNGAEWEDAACGEYVRDDVNNTFTVQICHFSQFQVVGTTLRQYLPAILR